MPFTIGGEWIPDKPAPQPHKPLKIFKEKRGSSIVTLIRNLPLSSKEMKELCSALKRHLGCGGAIKDDHIELQGDKVEAAKKYLKENKR
ncbi:MAG: translation initiation factor [Parachlamydia sp.]|jgi:translation initiation factor 1|nr:translation initiation factor [Parachlamydia sp.]